MNASTSFLLRLDEIERVAVAIASKLAPWLTTIPTAWTIMDNVVRQYDWPPIVAGLAGVGLETLGVSVTSTAVRFWVYNKTRERNDDPARPFLLALVASVAYFAGAIILTGALENLVMAIFPVMSLAGSVTLALNAIDTALIERLKVTIAEEKHDANVLAQKNEERKEKEKADRKAAREAAKSAKETAPVVQTVVQDAKPIAQTKYDRYASMQKSRNGQGPMEVETIMSTFKVCKRTAYNYLEKYYEGKKQDETEVEY